MPETRNADAFRASGVRRTLPPTSPSPSFIVRVCLYIIISRVFKKKRVKKDIPEPLPSSLSRMVIMVVWHGNVAASPFDSLVVEIKQSVKRKIINNLKKKHTVTNVALLRG